LRAPDVYLERTDTSSRTESPLGKDTPVSYYFPMFPREEITNTSILYLLGPYPWRNILVSAELRLG